MGEFELKALPLYKRVERGLVRAYKISAPDWVQRAIFRGEGFEESFNAEELKELVLMPEYEGELLVTLEGKGRREEKTLHIKPGRKWEIYLLHHTHTDIGYTDVQVQVFEDHAEFLDMVLDFCKQTDDYPDDAKFRWVCETAWTVDNYIRRRDEEKVKELINRIKEGRVEVTALYLNVTELYSLETLIRSLYFAKGLERKFGINVEVAMNSDVPGISWGVVEILAGCGVPYLSMAVDEIRAFKPEIESPFWWIAPSGKRVLAWNSSDWSWYAQGYIIGFKDSYEQVLQNLPKFLSELEEKGYKYPVTSIRAGVDNVAPQRVISDIVKRWNEEWEYPHIRLATAYEFFRRMEDEWGKEFPEYKLGWPDWWADGNGTAALEVALSREAGRFIDRAEKLFAINWAGSSKAGEAEKLQQALEEKLFFDEHTWGAYNSITHPDVPFVHAQWTTKRLFAYNAYYIAQKALDDAAGEFVEEGEEGIAAFNPMAWEREEVVEFPYEGESLVLIDEETGEKIECAIEERKQILNDPWLAGVPEIREKLAIARVALPALGWKFFKFSEGEAAGSGVKTGENYIENEYYKVSFVDGELQIYDKVAKREINGKGAYPFGAYIYEELTSKRGRWAMGDGIKRYGARFRRYGVVWERAEVDGKGFVGEIRLFGKCKRTPWIVCKVRLYEGVDRVDIAYELKKNPTEKGEGVYIAFPFNIKDPEVYLEMAGAIMRVGEQFPGTATDWYNPQNTVYLKGKDGYGVVLAMRDAPLLHVGGLNAGKWLKEPPTGSAEIYSWIMNNYWITNFPARQGGVYEFKYFIKGHVGKIYEAVKFAWGTTSGVYLRKGGGCKLQGEVCKISDEGVLLAAFKEHRWGRGITLRLWNLEEKDKEVEVKLAFPVKSARLLDMCEEDAGEELPAEGQAVKLKLRGWEIKTVLVALGDEK